MKIILILIYATLFLYANVSFSHEDNDHLILKKYLTGSLKNLVIHQIPKPVPEIQLRWAENSSETDLLKQNKVTVINFWATWCAPCREEMPSLSKLIESVKEDNFSIIVVAAGRNSDESINKFFLSHEISNFKSYRDPKGELSSALGVLGLPTTIIIDQHSREVARLIGGADWNSETAIQLIKHMLRDHNKLQ